MAVNPVTSFFPRWAGLLRRNNLKVLPSREVCATNGVCGRLCNTPLVLQKVPARTLFQFLWVCWISMETSSHLLKLKSPPFSFHVDRLGSVRTLCALRLRVGCPTRTHCSWLVISFARVIEGSKSDLVVGVVVTVCQRFWVDHL